MKENYFLFQVIVVAFVQQEEAKTIFSQDSKEEANASKENGKQAMGWDC